MRELNDEERRALLEHYYAMDPGIVVNTVRYFVRIAIDDQAVMFTAINPYPRSSEGTVRVPRAVYDTINTGMGMCWLYTHALERLEAEIQRGALMREAASVVQ